MPANLHRQRWCSKLTRPVDLYRPKTAEGWVNLYDRIERMTQLGPIFVDITSVSPLPAHILR